MSLTTAPAKGSLTERVVMATASLLLLRGVRRLRTAEIAAEAGTTESTMNRHFPGGLDAILASTYDECWRLVNQHLSAAGFENPRPESPVAQLLADTGALWSMHSDPNQATAATVAFLFLRRHNEIFESDDHASAEQARFERRLRTLCDLIAAEDAESAGDAGGEPAVLQQLILNYCATVWLTWYCMPVGSNDVTSEHDLTADEAQLGLLVLLEQFANMGAENRGPSPRHPRHDEVTG
jgi:AcrR family transcriptional regulator